MQFLTTISLPMRILIIIAVLAGSHIIVLLIRHLSERLMKARFTSSASKVRSIVSLVTSIVVFMLYFGAFGLVLRELDVSLTAYLASASILGLAIGFGSQGLVQDVVTGLTVVFSDLFDVGDMVEISGQTGIVKSIGMRFIILINSMGAEVFIPNRTIANVVNYPRGYVRCLADFVLPEDTNLAMRIEKIIMITAKATAERFPGIILTDPTLEGRQKKSSGKEFLRVKFRLWPGRTGLIETSFKQEIIEALKIIDPSYADWMATVNYEVEQKPVTLQHRTEKKKR